MERWVGKVALVTGASAGIGADIVVELDKAGVKVSGLARRIELVEELKTKAGNVKGEIIPIKGDVSKENEIEAVFKTIKEKFGAIHILVNNAGLGRFGTISEEKLQWFRETFDVNVMGVVICTQFALKLMKEAGVNDGHIIHMNGNWGHKVPNLGQPVLNVLPASKFALTAFTESLRQELVFLKSKIKVTSISPGLVATEAIATVSTASGLPQNNDIAKALQNSPALKGKDVADAVLYVLSTPPHVQVHELMIKPVGERH